MNSLNQLSLKLKSLSVFNRLHTQPLFIRVQYLLDKSQVGTESERIKAYSDLTSLLYEENENLSSAILEATLGCENAYVKRCIIDCRPSALLKKQWERELLILQEISLLKSSDFHFEQVVLGEWETTAFDFISLATQQNKQIYKKGYGMYAKYNMFYIHNKKITPVLCSDTQTLDDFYEYERERASVVKNTEALLAGKVASHLLLYGDAGTGKSSTIKAIVNTYAKQGLRLVEIKKNQLYLLSDLISELAKQPVKFILFIDDLSFQCNDENFATLKSMLEGSASAIANNVCIYATSNRRHLVKENHQSRIGDEIHLQDTIQETLSLSSRFGLTITFTKCDKPTYLAIVDELAKLHHINMESNTLHVKAEAFAIRHHGRSPRTAKQFITLLSNEI